MRPKAHQYKPDQSGQATRILTTPTGKIERLIIITAISIAIILTSVASAYGAAAGRITGTVVDSASGDPIVGASVILVGTTRGAMSDFDGRFIIRQIEPGSCTIRISHLDYVTMDITDVEVTTDLTSDLGTIKLPLKTDTSHEKITVVGQRDILQRFDVSSVPTLPKSEVDRKSPKTVDELLRETAGVITNSKGEVYIRGGRTVEISCVIDGQSIGDPLGALGPAGKTQGEIPMRPRYPAGPFDHDEQRFDDMYFHDYGVNPWTDTRRDSRSTFAADVDDASFIITRAFLERGHLPPPDAVRTEEFINHFDYDYDGSFRETFRVFIEGAPSPFAPEVDLLRIGIKGRDIPRQQRADANLVFVIDRSSSMQRERRLELVKDALHLLLTQLRPSDRIAIVAFDTRAEIILRPTTANRKAEIQRAIDMVFPTGSTNVEHGLKLGFELADQMFTRGKINRVMLLSDGVANTGRVQPEQLLRMIRRYAERGITLTTVGVGMGNYNDVLLEKLGNKGNGGYAYVDSRDEAYRIFVEKLTGTLQVIARDVKLQVTFNPEIIASYRLLGYENRDVPDHKFRDDRHDGGEVGAGHEVTAVYQVQYHRHSRSGDLGTVAIRYKDPERTERVHEITGDISRRHLQRHFDRTSGSFQLAIVAAEFAEILRQANAWPGHASLTDLERRAARLARHMESPQVEQLVDMILKAHKHEDHLADR
jgi:Ca-activated chloride channel homolog